MTGMPQRETVPIAPDDSRKQLGAFLRSRRESLDPQRLGLPRVGRRRTPGLRREEVAMLADVGVTWYTWLEQGRDVNPSSAVMAAVAKALQCTPTEARHLFVLAGLPPGEAPQAVCCEGISEGTRRLLENDPHYSRDGMGAYYLTLNRNKQCSCGCHAVRVLRQAFICAAIYFAVPFCLMHPRPWYIH